jgi:dienelactone hydrolase
VTTILNRKRKVQRPHRRSNLCGRFKPAVSFVALFLFGAASPPEAFAAVPAPEGRAPNASVSTAHLPAFLPGSDPLVGQEDLARLTNSGWHDYLSAEIAAKKQTREKLWARDVSSPEAYTRSVEPNRERLRRHLGVIDSRVAAPQLEIVSPADHPGPLAETTAYQAWAVRWPVLAGVHGEGIMLRPRGEPTALVVLVPDADQLPEELAGLTGNHSAGASVACRLAGSGAVVIIPVLANRGPKHAGDDRLGIATNQSQREWIYRQATEVGRHVAGYEIQKILAVIDWFSSSGRAGRPVGVAGNGEGGLLAFYAAALDTRIAASWVGGYFQPREQVWREPLYRNVWGLLEEFGDAEIATLVAPRTLVVEPSRGPEISSPPAKISGPAYARSAAPGVIANPTFGAIRGEWLRALALAGPGVTRQFHFAAGPEETLGLFGGEKALRVFWTGLAATQPAGEVEPWTKTLPPSPQALAEREHRTIRELQDHAQTLIRLSEYARDEFFWSRVKPSTPDAWQAQLAPFRRQLTRDVIGQLPDTNAPLRPRTRIAPEFSNAKWTAYTVVLDVFPGVITWGHLLLPNDLKVGERRPVVVCQHGSGGLPPDTFEENPAVRAHQIYQGFAARLAARGFVVFAPYLPNRVGGEDYKELQRKANLLRQSLFSITTRSHERLLLWLHQQPFVDPARIACYGMSYGAKAAIRAVAALEGYCLAICSGDFNDNVAAVTTVRHDKNEAMYYPDYELVEYNLANTFNYAEMAALIAPRPFMVEFGYNDRAVQLEGAAAEYAKVARLYFRLGIPERTAIEFFDGGHTVPGRGTFEFLHRFLRWPKP